MTLDDLEAVVRAREEAGAARVILSVRRKRAPGHSGQLLPGVPCVYAAWDGERAVADVATADLRRYVDRRRAEDA